MELEWDQSETRVGLREGERQDSCETRAHIRSSSNSSSRNGRVIRVISGSSYGKQVILEVISLTRQDGD